MADAADERDRRTIARLTEELLPTLIERLASSDLGELEVRENGWRIRLRRPDANSGNGEAGPMPGTRAAPDGWRPEAAQRPRRTERHARPEPPRGIVTSVAIGYFAPRDGVAAGASLHKGDVIGFVDVLGVRQEIVSPLDGVLRALDVEPGQAVEYGQPIGRVEPHA